MRDSTELTPGGSGSEHAYREITLRLAQARVTSDRQLRDVLKDVTEASAAALGVSRVSVWFFLDERRSIRCHYLHEPDRGDGYAGTILHASDFPVYFSVLESSRVIRFVYREGDPMSEELQHSYLAPLGITAMLDAPIYQGGEVVGIVCHEYIGSPHHLASDLTVILERGRDLTQTLMTLGRTNGQRPRVVSPADVLMSSLALLRGAAGPRVHVEVRAAGNISRILIDPLQLERAVVNLVVNARDAMPVGGVVTIEVREETIGQTADRQSTFVVIEVLDNGEGMDNATRERMFDTFFTTKGTKGKGLGLAIVNQVVTLAGGFIQVDSAAGQGTSVRLYLPSIAASEPGTNGMRLA